MVVIQSLRDTLQALPEKTVFTLPTLTKVISLKLEYRVGDANTTIYNGPDPKLPFANSELFYATISQSRRLTACDQGCKDVYEITFDVKDSNFTFKAGDTIGNKESKIPTHVPVKSTLRQVLTDCLDLRCLLKKLFLLAISRYTKEDNERQVLEYLSSKEGSTAYKTHILNKQINILDIFTLFPSCKPPIEVLLSYLPKLLPRPYSIVNSYLEDSNAIKICFSVMNLGNNRRGLTTGLLEDHILNKNINLEHSLNDLCLTDHKQRSEFKVPIYMRKNISGFSLSENLETPLIFIGPGTGVAPFIGFLQEIEYAKKKNSKGKFGTVDLFFGCRNPELDFIYEKELKGFLSRNVLNSLNVSFSRVDNNEVKYVQDAVMNEGEKIAQLIKDGANIFVCGDVRTIAEQIKDVLIKCLTKYDNCLENHEKYIVQMEKDRRYIVDAWC
ncbi:methionine synthase reductase isoform X2 [Bombyx mori]|uniref:Methionine synthase reductase n=1 Tax=Bombyx mori TaxID=7091 RepID=A0A8R2AQ02_BOMMO|nr:methionine synthase reductase isoform X2 [Bombyx mori]